MRQVVVLVLELQQRICVIGEVLLVEQLLSSPRMGLFQRGLGTANTGCERFLRILRVG